MLEVKDLLCNQTIISKIILYSILISFTFADMIT
jgi:hypothetical protein